jgi:CHAT domain
MTAGEPALSRPPIYAVLFHAETVEDPYSPLVTVQDGADSAATAPHGLDREVAAALPGLWYCLHLPNTLGELVDVPAVHLKAFQALHLDHHIVLAPIQIFDPAHVGARLDGGSPVLAVCPDDLLGEATRRCETLGFAFPPVAFSQLSNDSLRAHWRAIHARFVPEREYLGREPRLTDRLDLAATDLPRRWLARQFGDPTASRFVAEGRLDGLVHQALSEQAVLATTARLEREQATPEVAEQRWRQVIEEERARMRIPVALGLPGVAPTYARNVYDRSLRDRIAPLAAVDETDIWSPTMSERDDASVERAAIALVTAHRAVARGGIGVMLSSVPADAFTLLLQLELHLQAPRPRGSTVWRLLDRLNAVTEQMWTDALAALVARASPLTVFSNFPLGLLRLPGDTAPLAARVPIAYRPLLPLTRTVQAELLHVPAVDLSTHLRVLVAECIPAEDRVGAKSRDGWHFVAEHIADAAGPITVEVVETLSIAALREAIADKRPHVLVISAHGLLSPRRDVAGIQVGEDALVHQGVGPLPPVVLLSACHVAPRGTGTVSITDLLLREGAVAVLGTQIPVDVRSNAMLMMRLLVNVAEVIAGRRESHSTLLDVWHHVQTSNAVNDILSGSESLEAWGMSPTASGVPVIQELMGVRSAGRLGTGDIYADTERILGELADEQGNGPRVRNWFRHPGYVPESLFYVFAGSPERVYLRSLAQTVTSA